MNRRGFSLIEVNLAIFVVAVGLLTLFSLFPAGLKEGEAGYSDTHTSLFADYVLSTVRANALGISSKTWDNENNLKKALVHNLSITVGGNQPHSIQFPSGSKLYVRYYISFIDLGNNVWGVALWLASGRYGTSDLNKFQKSAYMYYTEVFYSGMP